MRFSGELAKTPICSGNLHKTDFGLRREKSGSRSSAKMVKIKIGRIEKNKQGKKAGYVGREGRGWKAKTNTGSNAK